MTLRFSWTRERRNAKPIITVKDGDQPLRVEKVDLFDPAARSRFAAATVNGRSDIAVADIETALLNLAGELAEGADDDGSVDPASLPDGCRLFVHPQPGEPSPIQSPGWSAEGRQKAGSGGWKASRPRTRPRCSSGWPNGLPTFSTYQGNTRRVLRRHWSAGRCSPTFITHGRRCHTFTSVALSDRARVGFLRFSPGLCSVHWLPAT